jgi:DNA-binding CsgD family transcriptional regulator
MIAETSMVRIERGNDWALTQLTARLTAIDPALRVRSRWTDALTCYQAMLCAALGDLARAAETLAPLAAESPITRLELARLALYSGEDVGALISAQSIGDAVLTKRQLLDRCLISAVSAWACGRIDDAFDALRRAAGQLETQGTYSSMWGVPYDMLHEIAVEAREQGVCDIVELVEGVPEPVRSRRYERLTEMELRTLAAIAEHLNANRAAASLFVTQATVKKHLASVYRKLRAKNRDEAILVATRMGLLGDAR